MGCRRAPASVGPACRPDSPLEAILVPRPAIHVGFWPAITRRQCPPSPLPRLSSLGRGRVRPLAWCSRPRSSTALLEGALPAGIIPFVTHRQPDPAPGAEPERGFVVAVLRPGVDADAELAELHELALTAGVEPVAELTQQRGSPDSRTYVGKGKFAELQDAYAASGAEVL